MKRIVKLAALAATLVAVQGFASAQESADGLQFVSYQEPNYGAYTVEVPQGWQIDAGTLDVLGELSPSIYLFSPGDTAVVVAGAPEAQLYVEPTEMLGLTEGNIVPLGDFNAVVKHYQAPVEYLQDYLANVLLAGVCEELTFTDTLAYEQTEAGFREGEVTLDCLYPDGQAFGYFYVSVVNDRIPDLGPVWMASEIYGYIAEPGYEAQADAALMRIVESYTPGAAMSQTVSQPAQTYSEPVYTEQTYADPDYAEPSYSEPSSSGSSDEFLQAQQDYYMQHQQTAMISNMMQMQHETSMAIINNIGSSSYEYEYEWTYDYD